MSNSNNTFGGDVTTPDDFELRDLAPNLTLCDKYRLEKEAGAGGMGIVWKAWDEVGERWVALKFVPPEIRHSDNAMAQVKTVFQTVQALNHTNIGPVYGLEKDSTFGYFIVKKWLEGFTLNEKKIPLEQIPDVLAKVADALDYAHEKRVMHRDVKPSNIFVETNGDVFLIDFGIAAEIQNSISQNTSSTICRTSGTRPYMAPEQWRGQYQDGQTDQYALGVVAYQFYSGRLPFQNSDLALLRMAVLQDPPERLENVPPEVNTAIQRALSKDRKERFNSCGEFVKALAESAKQEPKPSPIPKQDSKPEPNAQNILDHLVDVVKKAEETKRRQAEENLRQRINTLEEKINEEYKSSSYGEMITHLQELLQLKPENAKALWLLEQATKKLGGRAGDRKIIQIFGIDYAFRWCPPGEFMMGGESYYTNAKPVHKVKLTKGFWLLETQVTQAMWLSVMGTNPSWYKKGLFIQEDDFLRPVENVSWNACVSFCLKLSQILNLQVQLPTEAQWEYACRAGTTGDYAGDLDSMAWYFKNSDKITHPVGQKKPNAWGLYDMHGNVREWCSDYYDKDYYSRSPMTDPENTVPSWYHVHRGGDLGSTTAHCRAADRIWCVPWFRIPALGFRILLPASPEK